MVIRSMWRWLGAIVSLAVLLVILIILFIYSGIYNVSAIYPDSAPLAWVLGTISDNSVKRHSKEIKVPPLDNSKMIQAGFRRYHTDCVMCHGAPGIPIGDIGKGLKPDPPELKKIQVT